MIPIQFHRLAIIDVQRIQKHYSICNPAAAARFRTVFDQACLRIAADPSSYPVSKAPYRFLRVKRFPNVIHFRELDDGRIMDFAVAHTSRRPGYWRRRK
jgi:hypothetical protein